MKYPVGNALPRRLASRKKQVRLNLQRRPSPKPEEEKVGAGRRSHFWRWVTIVSLLHVGVLSLLYYLYEAIPATPPPPVPFMELLPVGEVVKGQAKPQEAPKVGPSTPAPSSVPTPPPAPTPTPPAPVVPPAPPEAVQPPAPEVKPVEMKPLEPKPDVPALTQQKPVPPTPPKPAKTPKVKVDLNLVDRTAPAKTTAKHVPKKTHVKKPTPAIPDETASDQASPETSGLSKEQIAEKLGENLQAAGVENEVRTGQDGAEQSQANQFQDFYNSVRDQVMSKWEHPDVLDPSAVDPEVVIHVELDGRVPAESVMLTRSSGNQAYDDSALAAAKSLGYLLQPLPDGCPPDIHITFKLTR